MQIISKCQDEEEIHIVTSGWSQQYDMIGMFKVIPICAHYNPELHANIISLKDVSLISVACVTMDTSQERAIDVHLSNDNIMNTKECSEGLYFLTLPLLPP